MPCMIFHPSMGSNLGSDMALGTKSKFFLFLTIPTAFIFYDIDIF